MKSTIFQKIYNADLNYLEKSEIFINNTNSIKIKYDETDSVFVPYTNENFVLKNNEEYFNNINRQIYNNYFNNDKINMNQHKNVKINNTGKIKLDDINSIILLVEFLIKPYVNKINYNTEMLIELTELISKKLSIKNSVNDIKTLIEVLGLNPQKKIDLEVVKLR
jgi:hypothetical protein